MTPKQILEALDHHIIGQAEPKKAMAVALRNRWRRFKLSEESRSEVSPKNILLRGSTGIGKTELARRLAKLTDAPFYKVEMTKFSETGFVGQSVDEIIIGLYRVALKKIESRFRDLHRVAAQKHAYHEVAALLVSSQAQLPDGTAASPEKLSDIEALLRGDAGDLPHSPNDFVGSSLRGLSVSVPRAVMQSASDKVWPSAQVGDKHARPMAGGGGSSEVPGPYLLAQNLSGRTRGLQVGSMGLGGRGRDELGDGDVVSMRVSRALRTFEAAYFVSKLDAPALKARAVKSAEEEGIVFLDEIDKLITPPLYKNSGGDVSAEGVQQDLLPIVEGTDVRLSERDEDGSINTSNILFVAAGAFHKAKPTDLLPELQGRFPVIVQLTSLSRDDLKRILTEPTFSLIAQHTELMRVEGVDLRFTECGTDAIATAAFEANALLEDIGARRLVTVLERVLSDLSFDCSAVKGKTVTVDRAYVKSHMGDLLAQEDLRVQVL